MSYQELWSREMAAKEDRERELYGDDPRLSYQKNELAVNTTLEEFKKMTGSVYWSHLSTIQQNIAPVLYKNYEEFIRYLPAMFSKQDLERIENGTE